MSCMVMTPASSLFAVSIIPKFLFFSLNFSRSSAAFWPGIKVHAGKVSSSRGLWLSLKKSLEQR